MNMDYFYYIAFKLINMKKIMKPIVGLLFFAMISCSESNTKENSNIMDKEVETIENSVATREQQTANAIQFINDYLDAFANINSMDDIVDWVLRSNLASDNFKQTYYNMITEAYDADPIVGLGYDPVLDGQDADSKYELVSYDDQSHYLLIRGVNYAEFMTTMKIVEIDGKWLVDGSGDINIPDNQKPH